MHRQSGVQASLSRSTLGHLSSPHAKARQGQNLHPENLLLF